MSEADEASEAKPSPDDSARVAEALRKLGIPEERIERALDRGDAEAAVLEAALIPKIAERTITPREVEAAGGLTAEETAEFVRAMGFSRPGPDDQAITPDEAEVLMQLAAVQEIWPRELRQQTARVTGRLLARIARTEVQLFRLHTEPGIRDRYPDSADHLAALGRAFDQLLSIPDPLLTGVHRRWLEYELTQERVSAEEVHSDDRLPGAVDVTLLFCDLKDFTAFANAEGDAAAVEVIDAFFHTVDSERGEGRILKALGDGHMISYANPVAAVGAGERMIAAMRDRGSLGVHASVHRGIAIAREGDYFGTAVNLAARLLNTAGKDELVGTKAVVEASGERFRWESIGAHEIRGVAEPVDVFRLEGGVTG